MPATCDDRSFNQFRRDPVHRMREKRRPASQSIATATDDDISLDKGARPF
jgi:hypothetical protein